MIISYADIKTATTFATTNETLANDTDKAHNRIMYYVCGARNDSGKWNISLSAYRAKKPEKTILAQGAVLSDLKLVSRLNQMAKLAGKLILDVHYSDTDNKQIVIDGKK